MALRRQVEPEIVEGSAIERVKYRLDQRLELKIFHELSSVSDSFEKTTARPLSVFV